MTFNLKTTLNVSANNSIQLIQGLTKINLLIEIFGNDTFASGSRIERSFKKGYVFRLRWLQNGLRGSLVSASYGTEDFIFNVPNPLEPFDIEVIPNRYQFTYVVKVFEKVFNPSYANLTEKLGIPLSLLESFPESTLLALQGINLMANTDTRTTLAAIEAAALKADQALTVGQGAQTKADLTANSLVEAKTEMVLDRRFELSQAMFTLENGFMVADVTHDLTAGQPQMSLTDAQGDEQGFAQLIAKSPSVARVELSMSQYNDNSYPLTFLCQGSKGTAIVASVGQWVALGTSGRSVQLSNGNLIASQIGNLNPDFNAFRDTVGGALTGILEGFVRADGVYGVKTSTGYYYGVVNTWIAAGWNEADYNTDKTQPGSIIL